MEVPRQANESSGKQLAPGCHTRTQRAGESEGGRSQHQRNFSPGFSVKGQWLLMLPEHSGPQCPLQLFFTNM